jgi:hypothetical protein
MIMVMRIIANALAWYADIVGKIGKKMASNEKN